MSGPGRDAEDLDALAEDYVERLRCGEAPDLEDYARAYPRLAGRIRSLFPLLSVMEGVGGTPDSSDGGDARARERTRPAQARMPEQIGGYCILGLLGQGGMGRVYRAQAPQGAGDAGDVAIKVIHPHLVADPGCLARFLREAEAGRRIRHRNVVRTLDAGVIELDGVEAPYLVLEHVEGQTLRALLEEVGRVPERLCRRVGRRVAEALAAIHAEGVVHRDIKPANVLITADETIKVMDLGVALLQDEALRISGTGEFVGSLLYAAPEQLDGRKPDARTDLYALGLTLYEMAAGRLPARSGRAGTDPGLPHASPFFAAVVQTLLAREPEARFASAASVCDALKAGERGAWWRRRDRGRRTVPAWLRDSRLGPSPVLHGRDAELDALTTALERAQAGRGQVVLIQGDAGVGKSRLVYEWLDRVERERRGVQAVVVRHAPGSDVAQVPPLAEALVAAFGRNGLQQRIAAALGAGSVLARALARQVAKGPDGEPAGPLPATSLGTGWLRLLRGLARASPLVLVFEDLHFAGPEAQDLFLLLARGLAGDPVLLLGTTRPSQEDRYGADLRDLTHVTPLALGGLDTESCRALLRGARRHEQPLADEPTLIRKSDGNPFFLLEMVRVLGDRESDEEGLAAGGTAGIPSSVRSILERQLTRLTERQRELLEVGACCGYEFDPTLVARVAGLPLLRALKRFARLERTTGLLQTAGKNYAFRHHLVQEVLHEEMHPRLREAYHATIGRVLRARLTARGPPRAALPGPEAAALCQHFFAGGQAADAAPYAAPALEFLVLRGEYLRAIELAEAALDGSAHVDGSARVVVLRLLGASLQSVSRYDEARTRLEAALELADALGDYPETAHTRQDLGILLERLADHEGAVRMHRETADLAIASGDAVEEARARAGLAGVLMRHRHIAEALEHAGKAMALLPVQGHELVELEVVHTLAQVEVRRGESEHARTLLERASELAQRVGNRSREVAVISTLAHLSYRAGAFAAAHELLGRAMELARELGKRDDLPHLRINDATCLLFLGREDEAQAASEQALAEAVAVGHTTACIRARARLGEVLLARGHLGRALDELRAAFDEACRVGDPAAESSAARALARVLGTLGRADASKAVLDTWLERVRERERDAPLTAVFALSQRGHWLERAGRTAEAIDAFEQARELQQRDGLRHPGPALALGCAYVRVGEVERARTLLHEELERSRKSGSVAEETLASIYLAALPGGDALAARLLLERHEASLSRIVRIDAHYTLWRTTGDADHLRAAHENLAYLLGHAPEADREVMVRDLALFRGVREAWADASASRGRGR